MSYYIDLLEPPRDLNAALDVLGNAVGALYQRHWDDEQKVYYNDKPFDLNVQVFAQLWYRGDIKIFIARNQADDKPLGFLLGMVYRPMSYNATVFSVQDWYAGGDKSLEEALFDHMSKSIRMLNCDELLVPLPGVGAAPRLPSNWKPQRTFSLARYTKE